MRGKILLIDDDQDMIEFLTESLGEEGFETAACRSGEAALAALQQQSFEVIVSDVRMKGMDGLALCKTIVDDQPNTPVVLMTAFGSLEAAVQAMRNGAYDFLSKPFSIEELIVALDRGVAHTRLRKQIETLQSEIAELKPFSELLGQSDPMKELYRLLDRVAPLKTSILIQGETGTGKELVARAIHERGRKGRPFVAINCGAMPAALLESELFGHAKGAFTDAKSQRKGLLLRAQGGTLLLDEIGDMPLELQVKLLRVLQEQTLRPVGSDEEIPFQARIIAATHQDLEEAVEDKRFREDLYFRLNVIQIDLPPLRRRGNDVLVLAKSFLEYYAKEQGREAPRLSPALADQLLRYEWPGNIRELKNCMERAVALSDSPELGLAALPAKVRDYQAPAKRDLRSTSLEEWRSLAEVEQSYIRDVLSAVEGNKAQAARVLGITRKTLYRKLEKLDLDIETQ